MRNAECRDINGKLLTVKQAQAVTNLGENSVRKYAQESGAYLKIGGAARVDIDTLVNHLRTFKA